MSYSTSANLIWPMAAWRLSFGLFFDVENTITYVFPAHLSLIGAHLPVSGVNWGKWGDSVGRAFLGESASTPLCHRGRQTRAGGSGRPCQTPQCFSPQTSGTSLNRAVCTSNHNEPCRVLLSAAAPGDALMRWNSKDGSGIHIKTAEASFCLCPAHKCCLLCS